MNQCKVCLKEIKHCTCAHHHVTHKKGEVLLPVEKETLPEHHVTEEVAHTDLDLPKEESKSVKKRKGFLHK